MDKKGDNDAARCHTGTLYISINLFFLLGETLTFDTIATTVHLQLNSCIIAVPSTISMYNTSLEQTSCFSIAKKNAARPTNDLNIRYKIAASTTLLPDNNHTLISNKGHTIAYRTL